MLYEKKLTYCGTSNKNRKGPPDQIKTVKEWENELPAFFWKKDSPVMSFSCKSKSGRNVLLISTGNEDPDLCPEPHKK